MAVPLVQHITKGFQHNLTLRIRFMLGKCCTARTFVTFKWSNAQVSRFRGLTCHFAAHAIRCSFRFFLWNLSTFPQHNSRFGLEASVVMQSLSYPTKTVLSNKITRNRIVLSSKDSPRKLLRRRPYGRKKGGRKGEEKPGAAKIEFPTSRISPAPVGGGHRR